MTPAESVFVTGGTGAIGKHLVAHILNRTDYRLQLLLRQSSRDQSIEALLQNCFGLQPKAGYIARTHLINGDITLPGLGITPDQYTLLANQTTHIIHAAASTRFDLPLEKARGINVTGTERVAQLAQQCPNLIHMALLSTAFVAGKRIGSICEADLAHDSGFVNTYEQSKYEAEFSVARCDFPLGIYRLSTVMGHSVTGKVDHFTAPHHSLQLLNLGLVAMVPGTPDYVVDLIPSDFAARILFDLIFLHGNATCTYHITATPAKSYTLEELIDASIGCLAGDHSNSRQRIIQTPAIVSSDAFKLFQRSVLETGNPIHTGIVKALASFAGQLTYPKLFDQRNVLTALPSYPAELPDIRDYFGKIVRHCLESGWRNVQ